MDPNQGGNPQDPNQGGTPMPGGDTTQTPPAPQTPAEESPVNPPVETPASETPVTEPEPDTSGGGDTNPSGAPAA